MTLLSTCRPARSAEIRPLGLSTEENSASPPETKFIPPTGMAKKAVTRQKQPAGKIFSAIFLEKKIICRNFAAS